MRTKIGYLGIAVAAAVMIFQTNFQGLDQGAAFLDAAWVLLGWHAVWAAVGVVKLFIISLTFLGIAGATGAAAGSEMGLGGAAAGGALGLAGGGCLLGLAWLRFAVCRGLLIGGSYMLCMSGAVGQALNQFDTNSLIAGGVMLVFGILMLKNRSSSSSND